VLIDSLDSVTTDGNNNNRMKYMDFEVDPKYVQYIYSISSEYTRDIEKMTDIVSKECVFELKPIELADASTVIDLRLKKMGRTLQPLQKQEIMDKFSANSNVLYLKMCIDESYNWSSHDDLSVTRLNKDTPEMIRSLLSKLERYHGYKLVSRAFAYIAATRFGLSEDELIDVLSFDEEVMKDVLQYHTPDPRALPPIVLLRLLLDSGELVTKRNVLKAHRFFFYHNQFKEVIAQQYMAGDDFTKVHSNLGKFFLKKIDPTGGLTYKGTSSLGFSEVVYHLATGHEFDLAASIITDLHYLEHRRYFMDNAAYAVFSHGLYKDFELLLREANLANVRLKEVEQLACFFIDYRSQFYGGRNRNRISPWDPVPQGSMWTTQRYRGSGPLHYSDEKQWCCFDRTFANWQKPPNPFLWIRTAPPNGYILEKTRLANPQTAMKALQNPKPGGPPQFKPPSLTAQLPTDVWGLTTDDYSNMMNSDNYSFVAPRIAAVNDLCLFRPPIPYLFNEIRKSNVFTRGSTIENYMGNPFD